MSGSDSPKVGHVGDGADGEAAVDQAVVDEHVGHAEQRNPEALWEANTWSVRPQSDSWRLMPPSLSLAGGSDQPGRHSEWRLTAPKQRPGTKPRWKKP